MLKRRNNDDGNGKDRSAIAYALSLGFGVAIPLALFIVGGVWLDGSLNSSPIFLLLGVLFGMIGAGYSFYRLIDLSSKK
jgi:F0F1-type ATP synthase assembly protein I